MGKFNRDGGDRGFGGRGGGRPSFSRGGFGGGRGGDRGPVVMNDAICADCKKNCQVPFRPSGDKPVYCKDCFNKRGGGPERPSFGPMPRKNFGDRDDRGAARDGFSSNDIKTQLAMINIKLDKLLKNEQAPIAKVAPVKEIVTETPVAIKPKKVIKSKKVSKKK